MDRAPRWATVLVDCPEIRDLLTYRLPPKIEALPGDVVAVPVRSQIVGGAIVAVSMEPPPDIPSARIRDVMEVVAAGFVSQQYWSLLVRVADYYRAPLASVVRCALPPGLLGRSQRRFRLATEEFPTATVTNCSPSAQQILSLFQASKSKDYSARYLRQKVAQAAQGWQELLTLGWLESYLEPPRPPQPKRRNAVIWVAEPTAKLTPRQQELLDVLRRHGGQMWLGELLQTCRTSSATVQALVRAGCAIVEPREQLRLAMDVAGGSPRRDRPKTLNCWQQAAMERLQELTGYRRVLLHGVTGSGKTEVYLQAIAPVLARGRSALVLVPEIGLTPQIVDRFRARFERRVCVYHSGLSEGERYDTWRQMLAGEPQVVIGTRSAIFAPLPQVGLIVLDEEHDASYKQTQTAPLYHAGTVAAWRAQLEDCPLILGSATPALTTWADREKLYLPLPERINARPLPAIEIVDLRQELAQGNRSIFSQALQTAIAQVLARKEQGILFVPRRGHSTFVSCRSCGYVLECPTCDVAFSYHYTHPGAREHLRCHYCDRQQAQPRHCPKCGSPYLKHFGSGTQRVVLELQTLFPELRCLRFDSDTTRAKGAHRALLERFTRGEADFLVGTQMLTKGIDCDRVTLVGVMAADGLLFRADYRAGERAFQTLMQVAGRAGRGAAPGRVLIQTYAPEHPALAAVQALSYDRFATAELARRAASGYPPHGKLILLQLSGPNELQVRETAAAIAATCARSCTPPHGCVLGPAPAAVARIAQRFRYQVLLRFTSDAKIAFDRSELRSLCPREVSLSIDVDPLEIG